MIFFCINLKQINRRHDVSDSFAMNVSPHVDYAFITALVVIFQKINEANAGGGGGEGGDGGGGDGGGGDGGGAGCGGGGGG